VALLRGLRAKRLVLDGEVVSFDEEGGRTSIGSGRV
jgi:hypothetical protein